MFSVITPAASLSLVDIDQLKLAAGVTGTTQDALFTTLELNASAAVTSACNVVMDKTFRPTLRSETVRDVIKVKCNTHGVVLSRMFVTAVTSVKINGTLIDPACYEYESSPAVLYKVSGNRLMLWNECTIEVEYVAGFTTVPQALQLVTTKLATSEYFKVGRDQDVKRIKVEGVEEREFRGSVITNSVLPSDMMNMLRPFINHRF
jgi:hypothetical protein